MKKVNQCLILAAGNGTRIRAVSAGLPKPLVDFQGKPILEHIIRRAHQAGIDNFVIVVGYRSDLIRSWFDGRSLGVSITIVENPDYHKANGISALRARNDIHENFLLLMADHIFEPETARVLLKQRLAPGEVILAVDPNIDRIFDLDDATTLLPNLPGWSRRAPREHVNSPLGSGSGDRVWWSLAGCKNLGLAANTTRRQASGFLRANAW